MMFLDSVQRKKKTKKTMMVKEREGKKENGDVCIMMESYQTEMRRRLVRKDLEED